VGQRQPRQASPCLRSAEWPEKTPSVSANKKPHNRAGLLSYFDLVDFAMRSSSFKSSAVSSSSFGLEGGLRKGITSDIGLSPDGKTALYVLLPRNCRISAASFFY
jgi:hypothetical protein